MALKGNRKMSEVTLTKDNFNEVIENSKLPVLVDFWAPWCGPCKMLGPVVSGLAEKTAGKAVIAKLNIDDEPDLAAKFRVMSIPTLMVFKDGQVVGKTVGVQPEKELLKLLGL